MEIDRVKVAIIDQLKKFDEYSKKITLAKEAAPMDPGEKARLQAEFSESETRISNLEHEIAVEERVIYNILSEKPGKIKLLEKQNEKISRLKSAVNEREAMVESIISRLEGVAKKEKAAQEIGTIQAAYKQRARTTFPAPSIP